MIYDGHRQYLGKFIEEIAYGELKENAKRAAECAGIVEEYYDDYLVIKVEGFYNIVHIMFDNDPLELDTLVYPFDEKRIYPRQKIVQEIRYKRY